MNNVMTDIRKMFDELEIDLLKFQEIEKFAHALRTI